MEELLRIEGIVENVVYYNDDTGYSVLEVSCEDELVTVVGELGEVNEGEEVVLHGVFTTHPTHGKQFKASLCEASLPHDVTAIRKYLQGGALPYIGPALAKRIVDAFGAETMDIIASEPEKLAHIKGLTLPRAKAISAEFGKIFNIREAIAWLARFGINSSQAVEIYRIYGKDTIEIVANDPYVLCSGLLDLPFKMIDAIAADLQIDSESDRRIGAAILYVLRHNLQNGHTCLPALKLLQTASGFIGVEQERVNACVERLIEDEELASASIGEKEYLYLPDYYKAEQNIAAHLCRLSHFPKEAAKHADALINANELLTGMQYAPLQREAIRAALEQRALVLTGGPGTGKTTTVNAILACFEQSGERVALAAPTGRAAKRLSELTGRKAQTVHRLLEVDFSKDNIVRFIHNEKNKLRCDVVVIDEMSMVDVMLFESLLAALKPSCRVIMVGDEDQLPSVSAGNVLGAVISSGIVPVVCLKEIFRQAAQSLIVSNAHRIVDGEMPIKGDKSSDYFFLPASGEACARLVCSLVAQRLPTAYGYDAITDIQVLCPTKIGILGTVALNTRLQELLNPPSPAKNQLQFMGRIYREGDKVMQIKNNYDIQFTRDNGEDGVGAFNGDMGIIETVDVRSGGVVVRSEDRRIVYTQESLSQLDIAYAVTIHKSQGSEFDAVVIPLADVPPKLCYRNLLYTGVTRARSLCILAGQDKAVESMVHNAKNTMRFSCLSSFLKEGVI
ncbi:MAG: ATP-dependent RecD-like DNA helicase [Oscillospiraceae bacterium]